MWLAAFMSAWCDWKLTPYETEMPPMKILYFHVDAFADSLFRGNPAGVCLLDAWLPDTTLQNIAAENNLSETAFVVPREDGKYDLRWFTPAVEVDLCGHATLAAAFVLFRKVVPGAGSVYFETRSGSLAIVREGKVLTLIFPAWPPAVCSAPEALVRGLSRRPTEVLKSRDYLAVFDTEAEVHSLQPDFAALKTLDALGVIATAPGRDCDFVSRFFAPAAGIPEDPVTGSAYCTLIPYWAKRLGRMKLLARQISRRGGELLCQLRGQSVLIGGKAVLYSRGHIEIDDAVARTR
jgi:predicted PhzF superfamily epimerase YddE/YHI9